MIVEVHNLHRHFGPTRAVDGISFTLASGQVFGFIGPNGAGKTTTMRIMATLDEPTSGRVMIDGVSVTEDPYAARRVVGFMPDTLPEQRDVTVLDYIDFYARAYGLRKPHRSQTIAEVIEFTNLGGLLEKPLRALSKGMKQRVSLARAMIHDPLLLILDEPAAGLDPRARIELRELLRELAKRGKAILISSHILSELAEVCTGAIIIEHGRIVTAGTIDNLLHGWKRQQPRTRSEIAAAAAGSAAQSAGLDGDGSYAMVDGQTITLEDDPESNTAATDAQGQTVMIIRALTGPIELLKACLEHPQVQHAKPEEQDAVRVELAGGPEQQAELLEYLQAKGLRITEFQRHRVRLEEIFMRVTRGDVS